MSSSDCGSITLLNFTLLVAAAGLRIGRRGDLRDAAIRRDGNVSAPSRSVRVFGRAPAEVVSTTSHRDDEGVIGADADYRIAW